MKNLFIILLVIIFVVMSAVFFYMRSYAPAFHFVALETGNGIMALLSLTTYVIVRRQVGSRPQAFVRGVYGASFLKLMVCMVSILVYVLMNREYIHKPSVFVMFGIYAVYTIAETWVLYRSVRK